MDTALIDVECLYLREDAIIGHVDHWLAKEFAPRRIGRTIKDLVDAQEATMACGRRPASAALAAQ